tara:strand:- start:2288 stop:3220 length:933 start_codon:yes stop_codon:yes gene_type:complete
MEKLLIVGGSGFIGRNLAEWGHKEGIDVTILSKTGSVDNEFLPDVKVIKVDLLDDENLRESLKGKRFDFVVNLSGYIDHSDFFSGGELVLKVHFLGLVNLLSSIERDNLKSFINIGSSDEYGNQRAPQKETMRESPISPYSSAKVASTHLLQNLHRTEGFPATILRLFLVYGIGQKKDRFIPQIIDGCLSRNSFKTSEGKQLRDFTYVDDISRGIIMALRNKKVLGEVINLASGEAISIHSLINLIKNKIGYGDPDFGAIPYRSSENMELVANSEKARKILNWKPIIGIEEGLDLVIEDYLLRSIEQPKS